MTQGELFDSAIRALYEAAFDEDRFSVASKRIDEACGSKGNMLAIGDPDASGEIQISLAHIHYRGQRNVEYEREYFENWYMVDERIPRLRNLSDSELVPLRQLYTPYEQKHSLVFNDIVLRGNAQNGLETRLKLLDGGVISWSLGDPVDSDGWTSDRIEMIKHLMPHLRHYWRVQRTLVDAQATRHSLDEMLENNRVGVVHLNRLGQIVTANDAAMETLRANVGLRSEDAVLRATAPDDDKQLADLISGALDAIGRRGTGGTMRVRRTKPGPPLVVHVTPVMALGTDVRPLGVVALALIADLARRTRVNPILVAETLGLSATEARLSSMLVEGMKPREVAAVMGCADSTVRWHLHQIYKKLQIPNLTSLVQLILSISGLPGPLPPA